MAEVKQKCRSRTMETLNPILTLIYFLPLLFNPTNAAKFPAILIFGDSTVDTGNNDYVNTPLKADHNPYGKDFPGHEGSGRFCNGKLISDMAASFLGIKEAVPPFLDQSLSDDEIKTGVCFASAGAGYDTLTSVTTKAIPVVDQINHFKDYIKRLNGIVGEEEAKKLIGEALVLISASTNDFIINYYDIPTRSSQYTVSQYQDFLQNILQNFVKDLYSLGARNFVIAGLPPVGCLPIQMAAKYIAPPLYTCIEDQNKDAEAYNEKLVKLLSSLESSLSGTKIIYADVFKPLMDMVNNPSNYGIEQTKLGCCGTGIVEVGPLCNPRTPLCGDASKYIFWDCIHPTEAAYKNIFDALSKNFS